MADGADVVELFGADGEPTPPLKLKASTSPRPAARTCKHRKTEVDAGERRVYCTDCGEVVEAFDVLLALAQEDDRWRKARDAAMHAARNAEARRVDAVRAAQNADARVKRLVDRERELERSLDLLDAELRAFTPDS